MKKLLLILVFLSSVQGCLTAQSESNAIHCRVKGVLQDSLTLSGEEYATGRVYSIKKPEEMKKTFVTHRDGKFEFILTEEGDYLLRISSVGKRDTEKEFTISAADKTLDLGTLLIVETELLMNEVVVTALRPLVKMEVDRMEYDVEQDPDSKTDNLIEMLRKVPLVSVDGEENIEVNGSTKFLIHINGKPNNMISSNPKEVLRSMPANSVKRIEVITNPGSKYDAEGVTGVLNIITMGTGLQGYTATLNGGVSSTGINTGIWATLQQGKFTTSVRYNYGYYDPPSGSGENEYVVFNSDDNHHLRGENSYSYDGKWHHGGLEASFEMDTLRLLTVSGDFYAGAGNYDQWAATEMKNRIGDRSYSYNTEGANKYKYAWIGGSVDYQRSFKRDKEELFTFSYRLGSNLQHHKSNSEYTNIETLLPLEETVLARLTNMHSDNDRNNTEHSFQIDYTKPFTDKHQIETGAKYILRLNHSDGDFYRAPLGSEEYQPDEENSSKYEYNQDILAAYFSYRFKWNAISARAGARYEHTFQKVNYHQQSRPNFEVQYDDIVPSALLAYKLSDASNLRLSYDMRISRPGIWYLDPYVNRDTPLHLRYGNPDLDTEKSHSFHLSYSRSLQQFYMSLSGFYSFVNGSIEQYSFVKNDTIHSTYDNIGKRVNTGVSLYFNWNLTKTTRIYSNSNLSYSDYKSQAMDLRNHGFRFNGNGGIQQTLPGEIRLGIDGGGATRNINLQGKGNGYYHYGASLSRDFLKKKLVVSLRARNFFRRYQYFTGYEETADFRSSYRDRSYRMSYGINLSYRLGELNAAVKKTKRSIQNEDVKTSEPSPRGGD